MADAAQVVIPEVKPNLNGWRRSFDSMVEMRPLNFERLLTRTAGNSVTFSIYRAKILGGWLVAERPNDNLTFVPDPLHAWDGGSV